MIEYLALTGAAIVAFMLLDLIIFLYATEEVSTILPEHRYELVQYGANSYCLRYGIEGDWGYFHGTLRDDLTNQDNYGSYAATTPIPKQSLQSLEETLTKIKPCRSR